MEITNSAADGISRIRRRSLDSSQDFQASPLVDAGCPREGHSWIANFVLGERDADVVPVLQSWPAFVSAHLTSDIYERRRDSGFAAGRLAAKLSGHLLDQQPAVEIFVPRFAEQHPGELILEDEAAQ